MQTATILWLLPVMFMLHEFEEIIMLSVWRRKQAMRLQTPALQRMLQPLLSTSTEAFALAVAEEFILLAVLTYLGVERGWYLAWSAVLLGFLLHLGVHVIQGLLWRSYVPSLLTCLPVGIYGVWALLQMIERGLVQARQLVWPTLAAGVLIWINLQLALWLGHAWQRRFIVPLAVLPDSDPLV